MKKLLFGVRFRYGDRVRTQRFASSKTRMKWYVDRFLTRQWNGDSVEIVEWLDPEGWR